MSTFTATQLFHFANLERICSFVARPHKDKIITAFPFCSNKKNPVKALQRQAIRHVPRVSRDPSCSTECKRFYCELASKTLCTEMALYAIVQSSVVPVYLSNFIECDSSSAAHRESAWSSAASDVHFFFLPPPPFALAFFPRHAHKHMQINTVPRPLSVSVDMSADSDSPPVPVSHLGTRAKKKKKGPLRLVLSGCDAAYLPALLCLSHLSLVTAWIIRVIRFRFFFCFFFVKITLTEARFCSENPKAHYLVPVFSRFVSKKVATTTRKTLLCCWCLYRSCSALTSH